MDTEVLVGNIVSILVYFGGPIIPLLLLAILVGRWHSANDDPPTEAEQPHQTH
jgi:hypothetical protein